MIKIDVVAHNVEIRGCEKKSGVKGDYLIVRVDDVNGVRSEFIDRDVENESCYNRGDIGDLTFIVKDGRTRDGRPYLTMNIKSFNKNKKTLKEGFVKLDMNEAR